jgi:RNA polymerase sigma-70 factor (ECF subfamily)
MTTPGTRTTSWGAGAQFAATRWSVVLAAGGGKAGTVRRKALEELALAYWLPLYAYVRRQGSAPHQAEDSIQGFFARLLEKDSIAAVDRSKGKFRSFLLASLKHFLSNERDKARAKKRGGDVLHFALDTAEAESHYRAEPADDMTPERLYERRWALAVLDQVLAHLRREYADQGKAAMFEALKGSLAGRADAPAYAQLARRLDTTEGAVKVAAHRLRKRYRQILRDEIAQTVSAPELVDEEIRYLLRCL